MNPEVREIKEANKKHVCGFCNRSEVNSLMWGPLYQYQGITTHYFCMLFSAGLNQMGDDEQGIQGFLPRDIKKEFERGKKLKCKFCRQPRATVGCSVKKCKTSFHYPCGLENESLFQFIGNYEAYCKVHKVVTTIPIAKELWECPLCYENVTADQNPLWPPCCKKSVYHKDCMMKMSQNAGAHFFKCPLCNDKDGFSEAMRKAGVYVPDRDAAWEMETNAFSEQTRVYARCDMEPCLCPEGREHNSKDKVDTKWKIVRCCGCGAAAVHSKCAGLPILTYKCSTCSSILAGTRCSGDETDDEEGQDGSVRRRRRIPEVRQSNRIRRRYDSSSSDDDGQVRNIAEVLSEKISSGEYDSSDEECDSDEDQGSTQSFQEAFIGTKKINIVRPIYGKKEYKLVIENDGLEDSEDDEEDVEDEEEFTIDYSTKTVSIKNTSLKDTICSRRFRSHVNRKSMIKIDSENFHPAARSNRVEIFKAKLDKLRNLYAQIPDADSLEANDNQIIQVRTGLVEVSNNIPGGEGLEFLKTSVESVKPGPSNRFLRSNAAYPAITSSEEKHELESSDKNIEILNSKFEKQKSKPELLIIKKTPSKLNANEDKEKTQSVIKKAQSKLSETIENPIPPPGARTRNELKPLNDASSSNSSMKQLSTDEMPSTSHAIAKKMHISKSDVTIRERNNGTETKRDAKQQQRMAKVGERDTSVADKKNLSSLAHIERSKVCETTPHKKNPSSLTSETIKKGESCHKSKNKNTKEVGNDDPKIIMIKTPPPKTNLKQSKIDSWLSPTRTKDKNYVPELNEDKLPTNQTKGDVLSSGVEVSSTLVSIPKNGKSDNEINTNKKEESIEIASENNNAFPNSIIVLSDSEDSDCCMLDVEETKDDNNSSLKKRPSSSHRMANSSKSVTDCKDGQTETNRSRSYQYDDEDEIQIEVVKLVLKNEKTEAQPNIFDYNHCAVPVATAYLQFIDRMQNDKTLNQSPSKYFTEKNGPCLSKALIANSSAMSKNSERQKMAKIQCRETIIGSDRNEEIVISLDSSDDEDGSLSAPSARRLRPRQDNCGGKESLPNQDENGNTSSKRERSACSEDVEISGVRRSKRPRVADTSTT